MPFNGRFVDNIIRFAAERGADRKTLYEISGASPAELEEEDFRIETKIFNQVMRKALAMTGDPDLGLHAGEYLNLSAAGLMLQIMQSSSTIQESLQYVCSFANLGCSSMPMHMEVGEESLALIWTPDPIWWKEVPEIVEHVIDGSFAFTLREFSTLIRQTYRPLAVHYEFANRRDLQERGRVFNAPLLFEQERTQILLPLEILNQPILTRDFDLLQLLVRHAEKKLQEIQQSQGTINIVRRTILNLVKPQFPTIEEVAANLNQSVRTLQRRLKEENKTFKEVLEGIKYEFALIYLRKPKLTIAEVAELLQYAEASGFIRSFKRWTGTTPQQYREVLR